VRTFLENCFIAGCLAFVFWLVISAGVKFEVKVKGQEYGFTVGGKSSKEKAKWDTISYWNNCDKVYKLIVTEGVLQGQPIQTYLYAVYPMYGNGNIEQHKNYYYAELFDAQRLNSRVYDDMFTGSSSEVSYTVVGHYILTKNLDH